MFVFSSKPRIHGGRVNVSNDAYHQTGATPIEGPLLCGRTDHGYCPGWGGVSAAEVVRHSSATSFGARLGRVLFGALVETATVPDTFGSTNRRGGANAVPNRFLNTALVLLLRLGCRLEISAAPPTSGSKAVSRRVVTAALFTLRPFRADSRRHGGSGRETGLSLLLVYAY